MPPVTRLSRRRQVAIPERAHRILGNLLRDLGVIDQVVNLRRQITKVPVDLNIVCLRAGRDQGTVVCFAPGERVRDDDRAAVEEVLAAAGEAAALCMREEHIAAVVLDGEEVVADIVFVVPVDHAHAGPAAAQRGFEELAAHGRVGCQASAPHELLLLVLKFEAGGVAAVLVCFAVVDGHDPAPDLVVRTDFHLWPGPVPEIGH